ncbi:uncharacterized protein [Miscanthus floridulus]|uniref:uncharacterized protein n=1 Tax=Miscanthus floridulus TaxID=154761 RepID=UPI0034580B81
MMRPEKRWKGRDPLTGKFAPRACCSPAPSTAVKEAIPTAPTALSALPGFKKKYGMALAAGFKKKATRFSSATAPSSSMVPTRATTKKLTEARINLEAARKEKKAAAPAETSSSTKTCRWLHTTVPCAKAAAGGSNHGQAQSFEVPTRTMEEALNVVPKPVHQKLDALHWTLDDIKEVANKLAERQDKFDEAMATFGPMLNVMALKVEDLLKKFEDTMPPKPKL